MIGWTLCSGIGAPEMAAPWVDWRLASEIEPFPRAVLQERFGYVTPEEHNQGDPLLWGDMTEVTPELARAHGVPLPDLLVAGTPCQAFSIAGLRGGTDDARGNLTLKFVETCHAIVDARPDGKLVVLWENVPGVLSDKGNAFGCFLGGLVGAVDALPPPSDGSWPSEGMVQGPRSRAAWCVLDAQWFGVAQRRRRVFVVVDFGGACDPAQILLEPESLRGDRPTREKAGEDVAASSGSGTSHWNGGPHPALNQSHNTGGIGASNQEIFSQGGAGLVPDRVQGHHGDIAGTVSSKWSKGSGGPAGDETQNMVAFSAIPMNSGKDYVVRETEISQPLMAGGPVGGNQGGDYVVGQPPAVAFDLRGRDGGAQVESVGQSVSLRAADGGSSRSYIATVAFAENQQGAVRTADVVPALSIGGGKPGQGYPAVMDGPVVRRLMPVECARLQGAPDDHCAITYHGKPAADGNQYKAYGNSMAVPCIRWITERIKP